MWRLKSVDGKGFCRYFFRKRKSHETFYFKAHRLVIGMGGDDCVSAYVLGGVTGMSAYKDGAIAARKAHKQSIHYSQGNHRDYWIKQAEKDLDRFLWYKFMVEQTEKGHDNGS